MKLRILLLLVLGFIFSSGLSARDGDQDPVALVEKIAGHIFADVTQNQAAYSANPRLLEAMVRKDLIPLLDIDYSARLILGRAGRGLEKEKIDAFAESMSNLLINRYSKGLLEFSSKIKLQVLPQRSELNEKLTRVRTRVTLSSGGEAPVDYAFHKTAEGWKAFDVVVEGISYVTTYRNQIMPEVEADGIDSVIERLNTGQLQLTE